MTGSLRITTMTCGRGAAPACPKHGLPGNRVLDAGCGTGKSFLPLLERGFEVTACDQSEAMLDVAASKAGRHG